MHTKLLLLWHCSDGYGIILYMQGSGHWSTSSCSYMFGDRMNSKSVLDIRESTSYSVATTYNACTCAYCSLAVVHLLVRMFLLSCYHHDGGLWGCLKVGIYSYSIIQEGQSSYKWSHLVGHHMHDFSMWPTALQWRCKCSLTVALVCKSWDFFQGLRTWVGIEPTHSHLRCDALPIELPSSWEQGGGEKGYTSASSWCPFP